MRLKGKVAIITGGGKGIGKGVALAFAEEGADVAVADKDKAAAEQVAEEVRGYGRRALSMEVDVSDEAQVNAMAQLTLDELGSIDILVTCAGVWTYGSVVDISVKDWDRTLNVNLRGTFLCSKAVLPHMVSKKSGNIITFSSGGAGYGGSHGLRCAYVTSKWGVEGLTMSLAADFKSLNIRVNVLRPPTTPTEMGQLSFSSRIGREPTKEELATWATPRDAANAAVFLASDDSRMICGQVIRCAGMGVYQITDSKRL